MSAHPAKLERGEDEDYVDYLTRQGAAWTENPPAAPPGFELIECNAPVRHWPLYTITDDDFYPAYCLFCAYDEISEAHSGCAHSHHRAWRRWRITRKIAGWLYVTGITASGGGLKWGGGCNACITMPRWGRGKRHYVLGVKTDTWRCLLKMHHWPGDDVGLGYCSKCLPCPDCGSTTAGHDSSCEST